MNDFTKDDVQKLMRDSWHRGIVFGVAIMCPVAFIAYGIGRFLS